MSSLTSIIVTYPTWGPVSPKILWASLNSTIEPDEAFMRVDLFTKGPKCCEDLIFVAVTRGVFDVGKIMPSVVEDIQIFTSTSKHRFEEMKPLAWNHNGLYLPIDCPKCGRRRLKVNGLDLRVHCEKCGRDSSDVGWNFES